VANPFRNNRLGARALSSRSSAQDQPDAERRKAVPIAPNIDRNGSGLRQLRPRVVAPETEGARFAVFTTVRHRSISSRMRRSNAARASDMFRRMLAPFSETWQLVINTSTTIITFLMVFLIQNTQNRDTEAMQVKLDKLMRATRGAHNALLDLEELDEDALDAFRRRYQALASAARVGRASGVQDTGTPEP
jgi:low affinity Fe/Cu permease